MHAHSSKTRTHKINHETVKPLDHSDLHYQIEKRAYEIWLSSGCRDGEDVAQWLQAESEMQAGRQKDPQEAH